MAPLSSLTRADIYETGVFILAHYYGRNILSITWCQPRGLTLDISIKRRPDLLQYLQQHCRPGTLTAIRLLVKSACPLMHTKTGSGLVRAFAQAQP